MWLLELLIFILTFLIGWVLFGYMVVLWFMGLFRHVGALPVPQTWPFLTVIIPCYNEEALVESKLNNMRALDYPVECMEVIFVDGGSKDQTVSLLEQLIRPDEPYRIVRSPRRGKINQLNYVLTQAKGQIIVNSDTDAQLSADTLKYLVAEFAVSDDIWVVGAFCQPETRMMVERYYWQTQNKGRLIESDAFTSSIVVAPCYAFRRELMQSFPEDVVADDVYVAFLCNTLNHRTVYSRMAQAVEKRGPQTLGEFLPHKFRKSNAFLRETIRFFYRLPEMNGYWKTVLITRAAQQFLLPWMGLLWLAIAGALLSMFRWDVTVIALLVLFSMALVTSGVFRLVKLPEEPKIRGFFLSFQVYILTNLILVATALSYPFFRQGSIYARPGENTFPDGPAQKSSVEVSGGGAF